MLLRFVKIGVMLLLMTAGREINAGTVESRSAPVLMLGTSCAEGIGLADISVMHRLRSGFVPENPSLAATLKGLSLDFTYMPWLFDTAYMLGNFVINLSGLSAGFSFSSFRSSDFEHILTDGSVLPDPLSMSETLFGFSLAASVLSGPSRSLAAGGAVKYLSSMIHEYDGHLIVFDAGLAGALPGPFVQSSLLFGASLLNLGGTLTYIDEGSRLPLRLRTGAALLFPFLKPGHELSPCFEYVLDRESRIGLGLEYSFNRFIFVRCGYALLGQTGIFSRFTAGLGLKYRSFFINYGLRFLHEGDASMLHCLSLSLDLE